MLEDTGKSDGTNTETIKDRVAKAQGNVKDILYILENVSFGEYYIEAFKLLRNNMINSILTYNL